MIARATLALLLAALPGLPQSLSAGIKAGVPLTDAFDTVSDLANRRYFENRKRYTFGPMVELRLPFGLGVEFNALYKRLNYRSVTGPDAHGTVTAETKGSSWEFPLLMKLRSPGLLVRPYVAGGVNFRTLRGLKQFVTADVPGAVGARAERRDTPEELRETFAKGVVGAGGLEVKAPFVRVAPELRFTRWVERSFRDALNVFRSSQNQFEVLVGLSF